MSSLSDYSVGLSYDKLSGNVLQQIKLRLIDALGCAMGCYHLEPPRIARGHAMEISSAPGASLLGTRHRTSPEAAAFANGVMVRYLDFNDTSMSGNAGHPSDNVPAILAAAEYAGADMRAVIPAIVVAYEIQGRFGDACKDLRKNGWDSAIYVGIASAAAVSRVLGLSREQTANAIALATVPNAAMGQTRVGHLSMWKGCTAPNAARNAVFAALMAKRGMNGPPEVFEGGRGFKKQLGSSLQLRPFSNGEIPFAVETDKFKFYPCDYEAQCSITPALEFHKLLAGKIGDIAEIDIETYDHAVQISADGPAKWNPTSRETADHSIPYVIAVAIIRGAVWVEDFLDERIGDPDVHALMQKIKVRATDECNNAWPEAYPFRTTVTMKSGQQHVQEIRYAKGHPKNPMSAADVEAKFRRLCGPVMAAQQIDKALSRLWQLEDIKRAGEIMELFVLDEAAV